MTGQGTRGFVAVVLLVACLAGTAIAQLRDVMPQSVQIEDADTLLIEVEGSQYRIQLSGIDAPENTVNPKLQRDLQRTGLDSDALLSLGRAADEGLRRLLDEFAPYRLRFDPQQHDRYGRTPGDLVDAQGRLLSHRLVEAGYAVPVAARGAADAPLADIARAARAAGRGLWGSHATSAAAWAGPGTAPAH